MRGSRMALACGVLLGCTTSNPEFDGTTGGTATTATTASGTSDDPSSASVSDSASASVSDSVADSGPGPVSQGTDSGGQSTGVVPVDTSSGGVEAGHCCDAEDCDAAVAECTCELGPECCDGWNAETCPQIAVACGGSCNGETFPCCEPQREPACSGVALIPGFCLAHPECCLQQWHPKCVVDYDLATGECGLEDCYGMHETAGCDDPDIVQCVCEEEGHPECCTEQWDGNCVEIAKSC